MVGGDVRDDEADRPDVVGGATPGQGELVLRDGPAAPRSGVGTELSTLILTLRMIV